MLPRCPSRSGPAGGSSASSWTSDSPPSQGAFQILGSWELEPGELVVEISNRGTDGYVIADAVALQPVTD